MSGFVYFIRCQDRVKIGYSEDPEHRLTKINADAPFHCELLGFVSADDFPERELHDRFSGYRVHGEWFLAASDLLQFAAGVSIAVPIVLDRFERADLTGVSPIKAWRYAQKMTGLDAAKLVGVHTTIWNKWETGRFPIPAERVLTVERITGISRHVLRPDVFGVAA